MSSRRRFLVLSVLLTATLAGAFWQADVAPVAQAAEGPETLATGPSAVIGGNPDGDVTVVEFFDYQCPVCRQTAPEVEALIQGDPGIRMVYKEWPIFGPDSLYAARFALAARYQDKYEAMHQALMGTAGKVTKEAVHDAAFRAGVDVAQAEADMEAKRSEISAALDEAARQAESLGLRGTPGFVIGRYLVPGGASVDNLREVVADVRGE